MLTVDYGSVPVLMADAVQGFNPGTFEILKRSDQLADGMTGGVFETAFKSRAKCDSLGRVKGGVSAPSFYA
jgi:hypothetical protein